MGVACFGAAFRFRSFWDPFSNATIVAGARICLSVSVARCKVIGSASVFWFAKVRQRTGVVNVCDVCVLFHAFVSCAHCLWLVGGVGHFIAFLVIVSFHSRSGLRVPTFVDVIRLLCGGAYSQICGFVGFGHGSLFTVRVCAALLFAVLSMLRVVFFWRAPLFARRVFMRRFGLGAFHFHFTLSQWLP